jgi:hypothetical protein
VEQDASDGGKPFTAHSPGNLPSPAHTPMPSMSPTSARESESEDSSLAKATATPTDGAVLREVGTNSEKRRRNSSSAKQTHPDGVRRLSASKIQELTESLPIAALPDREPFDHPLSAGLAEANGRPSMAAQLKAAFTPEPVQIDARGNARALPGRPQGSRTLSTPPTNRRATTSQPTTNNTSPTRRNSFHPAPRPPPLNLGLDGASSLPSSAPRMAATPRGDAGDARPPSPMPTAIPLPPMSIPTHLQLELAGQRPSPLYLYHSYTADVPYESSAIKFERLKNFLLLPSFLERTMMFGALACLDAWLWTLTILPIRFCAALSVLMRWWAYLLAKEVRWMTGFVWAGLGRMWRRGRRGRAQSRTKSSDGYPSSTAEDSRSRSRAREPAARTPANGKPAEGPPARGVRLNGTAGPHAARASNGRLHTGYARHRRTKSMPSNLTLFHKADLLQGAVILFSSMALMQVDASRMYHFVRAQSAVKLYVIYNLVEVCDRLLSSLGQDIFECLFSSETLSRNASGRSKIMLPFGMFLLSLVYNVAHSMVLFYQVITLNVAVNSYSNALLTLLMSNQFVEVKSSVFKRCEKENLFQLALADIVERFQLWIVLIIIAMRNIAEVGGFSVPGTGVDVGLEDVKVPLHSASILPASFTLLPSWLASGEVLSPFFIVIGSELLVDWIKHAYINKFNNIKPNFYGRILDILCKDYYTNVGSLAILRVLELALTATLGIRYPGIDAAPRSSAPPTLLSFHPR